MVSKSPDFADIPVVQYSLYANNVPFFCINCENAKVERASGAYEYIGKGIFKEPHCKYALFIYASCVRGNNAVPLLFLC